MKPPVETVRVSRQGRDQLIKLKRMTGIENWNSLSRLALIASLSEKTVPPQLEHLEYEGGVEMSWKVFAGEYADMLAICLHLRGLQDGLSVTAEDGALTLKAHLHRGLGYLVAERNTPSITEILNYWLLSLPPKK